MTVFGLIKVLEGGFK